jgi:hypothetical protein
MSALAFSEPVRVAREFHNACQAVAERNLLELLGLVHGLKNIVRLPIDDHEWPEVLHYCTKLGLSVEKSSFRLATVRTTELGDTFTTNVPWDDPRGKGYICYIARDPALMPQADELEQKGTSLELAELYQYPRCCAEAYQDIMDGTYWADLLLRRSTGSRHSFFGNKLAYLFDGASLIPDYFPCSLDCEPTRSLAMVYEQLLRRIGLDAMVDSLRSRLSRPIVCGDRFAYQLQHYSYEPGRIRVGTASLHSWSDAAVPEIPDDSFLVTEANGPRVDVFRDGNRLGTLLMFDR